MRLKICLSLLLFLEFAVWGSYLTSFGTYLQVLGLGDRTGYFYALVGGVSLFMPALMGTVADRWIQPQRLLGLCHLLSSSALGIMAFYCREQGSAVNFYTLYILYMVWA